ncbi:hypothetical protein CC80DRAFT_456432, partial [Byssothecium circinans]
MGILLSAIRGTLDLLLPFTNPQTPLLQDLVHTAILCGTLYYAPQIAEHYNTHYAPSARTIPHTTDNAQNDVPHINEDVIHEPDTDDNDNHNEEIDRPPHTAAPPRPHIEDAPEENILEEEEEGEWQNPHDFANLPAFADAEAPPAGGAGPANPQPRAIPPNNRTIGTKKAKSLARRDQRRQYHEFQRYQAEQRRAAEANGREEREAALALEKARRWEEERRIAEKQRLERERKKEDERRDADDERERRERVVAFVRDEVMKRGAVDLVKVAAGEGKDRVWIERLVRASGMVTKMEMECGGGGSRVMVTGEGWIVRVDGELMAKAYADAVAFGEGRDGRVSFEEFGGIVERAVLARAKA